MAEKLISRRGEFIRDEDVDENLIRQKKENEKDLFTSLNFVNRITFVGEKLFN
jgi:hypothetical protein